LRGEESITDLCRKEGIHPTYYYKWSKAFLEAGKRQLNGDTIREASGARLFFNAGPIDFNPLLDLLLVPLHCLSLWFLRAPTQRMKQAAYVIHMVSDTD